MNKPGSLATHWGLRKDSWQNCVAAQADQSLHWVCMWYCRLCCAQAQIILQTIQSPSVKLIKKNKLFILVVGMKKHWVLSYPLSTLQRLWSDWTGCPSWSESPLGAQTILLVLSWGGSNAKNMEQNQLRTTCKHVNKLNFAPNFLSSVITAQLLSDSLAAMWMSWQLNHKLKSRKWHWRLVPLSGLTSWHLAPSYHEVTVTESESLSTEQLF